VILEIYPENDLNIIHNAKPKDKPEIKLGPIFNRTRKFNLEVEPGMPADNLISKSKLEIAPGNYTKKFHKYNSLIILL